MKCEFCGLEIPVEECIFARKKIINGKEYSFCCDQHLKKFESRK